MKPLFNKEDRLETLLAFPTSVVLLVQPFNTDKGRGGKGRGGGNRQCNFYGGTLAHGVPPLVKHRGGPDPLDPPGFMLLVSSTDCTCS